jgi:hypothetical protein
MLHVALSINRALRCGLEPDYKEGVRVVAVEISEELVVPSERASFLLACGLDTHPTND